MNPDLVAKGSLPFWNSRLTGHSSRVGLKTAPGMGMNGHPASLLYGLLTVHLEQVFCVGTHLILRLE